jgi:cytochrome c
MAFAKNLRRWHQEAYDAGFKIGFRQGVMEVVEVQIRAKFHDANDADFMPKLLAADQEDLMRYGVQLLSATTLEQVFA